VRLEVDTSRAPARATFDPAQLEHALVAMVTNAVEVSPEGGRVGVAIGSENGSWEIEVSDEGPGVPDGLSERIFEADFTTKQGGHGVGLTAARLIARQHGGTLRVRTHAESAYNGGAVFTLELPLVSQETAAVPET